MEESQGFQPDPGNPAVRDYRGASGNVAMVEMRSRLAYRKSEAGNPPPTAGAPELYPNRIHGLAIEALTEETGSNKLGQTFGTPRQSSTRPPSLTVRGEYSEQHALHGECSHNSSGCTDCGAGTGLLAAGRRLRSLFL